MRKYPKYLEKGMEFGRLTVIGIDSNSKTDKYGGNTLPSRWGYLCKCNCPKQSTVVVAKNRLITGHTRSCGCLKEEHTKRMQQNRIRSNPIEDCGDYIKIFFFNKDHGYCVIDKEDYWKVKNHCWARYYRKGMSTSYAQGHIKKDNHNIPNKSTIRMHQIILPTEEGFIPEHKDGNGLNNRKSNLRPATYSQNKMNQKKYKNNTSGCSGVSWDKRKNKWIVRVGKLSERVYIGAFTNKDSAIKARKEAEEKYHGEHSYDNSRGVKKIRRYSILEKERRKHELHKNSRRKN